MILIEPEDVLEGNVRFFVGDLEVNPSIWSHCAVCEHLSRRFLSFDDCDVDRIELREAPVQDRAKVAAG